MDCADAPRGMRAGGVRPVNCALLLVGCLVLTEAVEVPAAAALGLRGRAALGAVALVNMISNPTLNLCLLTLWHLVPELAGKGAGALLLVAVCEVGVVTVEWALLRATLPGSAAGLLPRCVLVNAASTGLGLLVWPLAA